MIFFRIFILISFLSIIIVLPAQTGLNEAGDNATIYFIRTSKTGKAINFKYFVDDNYVGKCKYGQYIKVEVEPGEHVIWSRAENMSFMEASLMAGKEYIVNAIPKMGALKARVSLSAIPNKDLGTEEALNYISELEIVEFDDEALSSEQTELSEMIGNNLLLYEQEWKGKKEMDYLSVPVNLDMTDSPKPFPETDDPEDDATEKENDEVNTSPVNQQYPFGPVSILFNPLGFLQFGPILEADIMLAKRISIVPHLRFAGLGVSMHAISGYDQLSAGSMAFGVGIRGFLGKFQRPGKTYIGVIFELGWGKGKDYPDTYRERRYEFATFSIIPHAGYRWRFSSGFNIGLGGSLAIAYTYKDERVYPTFYNYEGEVNVIPMAEFTLGWEIH